MNAVEDKLKSAEEKLKDTEGKMQELRDDTQKAVDAFFVETFARENKLVRRHQAWVSAGHQAPARPAFGDRDQALENARAEAEEVKEQLLTAEQDFVITQSEMDHYKVQAEVAET